MSTPVDRAAEALKLATIHEQNYELTRHALSIDTARALRALAADLPKLADENRRLDLSETQLIGERDAAEETVSTLFELVTGNSPEWSNLFGYSDAVEDVDAMMYRLKGAMTIASAARSFLEGLQAYRGRPDDEALVDTDQRIGCVEDLEDALLATVQANLHVFEGGSILVNADHRAIGAEAAEKRLADVEAVTDERVRSAIDWARGHSDSGFVDTDAENAATALTFLSAQVAEQAAEIERMSDRFTIMSHQSGEASRRAEAAEKRLAELEEKYESPGVVCNSEHVNHLPVSLWDCPICTAERKASADRVNQQLDVAVKALERIARNEEAVPDEETGGDALVSMSSETMAAIAYAALAAIRGAQPAPLAKDEGVVLSDVWSRKPPAEDLSCATCRWNGAPSVCGDKDCLGAEHKYRGWEAKEA